MLSSLAQILLCFFVGLDRCVFCLGVLGLGLGLGRGLSLHMRPSCHVMMVGFGVGR